jgi:hypothetical protein
VNFHSYVSLPEGNIDIDHGFEDVETFIFCSACETTYLGPMLL